MSSDSQRNQEVVPVSSSVSWTPGVSSSQFIRLVCDFSTVKPVLSGHSKIENTKVSRTGGSLMKDESIAGYSLGAICDSLNLH